MRWEQISGVCWADVVPWESMIKARAKNSLLVTDMFLNPAATGALQRQSVPWRRGVAALVAVKHYVIVDGDITCQACVVENYV